MLSEACLFIQKKTDTHIFCRHAHGNNGKAVRKCQQSFLQQQCLSEHFRNFLRHLRLEHGGKAATITPGQKFQKEKMCERKVFLFHVYIDFLLVLCV
jgi:hypothetical protein